MEYNNPVEQVMYILGLKHDPQFDTGLHAILHGANPGITNALDQLSAYGVVEANFHAWAKTMQMIQEEISNHISKVKEQIYGIIVDELDEAHLGGRWFEQIDIPPKDWINMAQDSSVFVRDSKVFCLPTPYLKIFEPILSAAAPPKTAL